MNQVTLVYNIIFNEGVICTGALASSGGSPDFDWSASVSRATPKLEVQPRHSGVDKNTLQKQVDAFLAAWELKLFVEHGRRVISFEYAGKRTVAADGSISLEFPCVKVEVTSDGGIVWPADWKLPAPPVQFKADTLPERLRNRFEQHLEGGEPLLSMIYFCVTDMGDVPSAQKYGFAKSVFRELNSIAANLGGSMTARKSNRDKKKKKAADEGRQLTSFEEHQLRRIILKMIERAAMQSGGVRFDEESMLTLADFPVLAQIKARFPGS